MIRVLSIRPERASLCRIFTQWHAHITRRLNALQRDDSKRPVNYAAAVAFGAEGYVEAYFPRRAGGRGGMTVRQGAGDREGLAVRGDDGPTFDHPAQAFDEGRRPIRERSSV